MGCSRHAPGKCWPVCSSLQVPATGRSLVAQQPAPDDHALTRVQCRLLSGELDPLLWSATVASSPFRAVSPMKLQVEFSGLEPLILCLQRRFEGVGQQSLCWPGQVSLFSGYRSMSVVSAPFWHAAGTANFVPTNPIDHRNGVKPILTVRPSAWEVEVLD